MRPNHLVSLIAIVLCLASIDTVPAQTTSTTLTLLSRDGRRALPTTPVGTQDYVFVDDLNSAFGTTAREDRLAGGLTITVRNRSAVLTADQTVVQANGRLVSLLAPVLRRDGRWLVPVDFIPRALSVLLETRLDLRRASRLLVMGDLRVPRIVVTVDAGVTNVSVIFEVTPSADARVSTQQGRLLVQFEADALELSLPPIPAQTFLLGIAQAELPGSVAVVTGPRYAQFKTSSSQSDAGSTRFVLDLLPATTTAAAAPAPDMRPSLNAAPVAGLRTLVIDPGHGGEELGAQGPRGTLEKELTLQVARRLRTLVESRLGLKVFLTREDDRTLALDERSAFANAHKADVFLSLHANAAVRPSLKGAEVYYLTVERADAEARKRADNSAAALPELGGGTRTIDLILWETAQARYLEQSSTLAGLIEQSLGSRLEMSPRAVRQAPFRVLVGANMPAALVEMGYLTNADQETQLISAEYQDHVVQAILEALLKFRDLLDTRAQ
ncbi:MAG: N-acetylmuramoyl-L-alanine amidase [Vicinamibacterales bacterium]